MKILVINSGSSSIKYKLFSVNGGGQSHELMIKKGAIEHIGEEGSTCPDHYSGLKKILSQIDQVDVVGHRVVHGGEKFKQPVCIDAAVIRKIKQCCDLAPLHNPANLTGILACKKLMPDIPQIAVFDTAFHQSIPSHVYTYGLPYRYYQKYGIRKYGFHGTSHDYVSQEAAVLLKKKLSQIKLITCHLGNGCSVAAIDQGKSVDTSMGFTPLEGLVMGTRCGDIDPALVTYLMRKEKLDYGQIEAILNKESGLKGISGISNDMRLLEEKVATGNIRAKLAIDVFVYRIKKYIGAYAAVMGGCDAIVFTAGIGENQEKVRRRICDGLCGYFRKKPKLLVISTNEELMIARQAYRVIKINKVVCEN